MPKLFKLEVSLLYRSLFRITLTIKNHCERVGDFIEIGNFEFHSGMYPPAK